MHVIENGDHELETLNHLVSYANKYREDFTAALWFDHAVHRLDIESSLKHLSSIISK